jgi:hypothetical protein
MIGEPVVELSILHRRLPADSPPWMHIISDDVWVGREDRASGDMPSSTPSSS